ncbi:MAG: formate/nitrite transporter family protein [Actinobacteria bacterium]|nr:formate/nitrite transporter family protein [Actinomycetota bacterium]
MAPEPAVREIASIMLAVTTFVAANLQHSPANMGYFALWMAETAQGPGWATALGWNIVPAGIGNMLGAAVLVALPFWYVFRPSAGTGDERAGS